MPRHARFVRVSCARGSRYGSAKAQGGVYPRMAPVIYVLAIVRAEQNLELDNVMHGI